MSNLPTTLHMHSAQLSLPKSLVSDSLSLVDLCSVALCRKRIWCLWKRFKVLAVVLVGLYNR